MFSTFISTYFSDEAFRSTLIDIIPEATILIF